MTLDDEDRAYLLQRGYTPELVELDKWFSFPVGHYKMPGLRFEVTEPQLATLCRYHTGTVTAVQLVNRHRKAYRKFPTLYANYLPILYMNYQDYERLAETRRIILTEGLFDRAAIIRCKPPAACGCILGLSVSDKLVRFLQHFSDRVFLAFDSDAPGKEGIQYVAKVLTEAGVVSFSLSGWCKDPAQWYEKAGEKKMAADLRDQIEGRL